jgi:signal transduction histidine kinase
MRMLIVAWRFMIRLLRHLGWGILLVPVAAMSVALFGLTLWTVAVVAGAAAVAVRRPLVAARLLPLSMIWAGITGLIMAARTPGSPISWINISVRAVPATVKGSWVTGGPPRPPRGTPMPVDGEGQVQAVPGKVVPPGVRPSVMLKGRVAQVFISGRKIGPPRRVSPWRVIVPQKGGSWQQVSPQKLPAASYTIVKPGKSLSEIAQSAVKPAHIPSRMVSFAQSAVFHVAGLWHARLLVPLALLLLTLGLWLAPRSLAGLRGRAAAVAPDLRRWLVENRWGVLLVPVALAGLSVFGVHSWTIAAVLLALIIVARWPRVAADLVPVLLAAFAVRGFLLASNWQQMAGAFQGPAFGRPPAGTAVLFGAVPVDSPSSALLAGAEASAFLALGAWLVPRTIGAHARSFVTPGTELELAGRVQRLTESRSHAVDTATAELRRIERDLHDGAQARLVALGMNLRAVERVLPANPQAALALVAEARETSVRALGELRDLIRGICPPVLADRGLGHAVRALALDTPLPTELDIDLPGRPSVPIESAAYFAVAEALANAVKHSGARRVQIRIRHASGIMRIEVADDGIGGADPARGTGLAGVERRLGTFDGIMAVSSPPGGPTMIVMEVPCALSSPKTSSC